MLVPFSWLQELVSVDLTPEEIASRLTMTGLEVEGVFEAYEELSSVISVRILAVTPHPHSDKLTVCQISDGKRDYQVVCGAPNVREGLKTAFAPPGTILFTGEKIKKAEIRGVPSEGVLCSAYEIGLSEDHSGILELPPETPLGQRVTKLLGLSEPILEISITPNRGDCLSLLGIAREVAAVCGIPFKGLALPSLPLGEDIFRLTQVRIEVPELCYRYAGRLLQNVTVRPSPFEIQKRLWLCGLRPINNIVDITNYVLLEVGQPLHAFDFDLLEGRRIVVRLAKEGEEILTLDGEKRVLTSETMVIADAQRPVAIAGVMGGEETAVTEKTKNVFLESAWFNPSNIRRTSQRLRLSTESSYRFERGIDPEGVILGLERATDYMVRLAGGEVIPGRIDEYPRPYTPPEIRLRPQKLSLYLKVDFSEPEIKETLEKVHVKVMKGVEGFICTPPSFRHDLRLEEDLIEEIARLYGYDRLPTSLPRAEIAGRPPSSRDRYLERLRHLMTALGLYEIINFSFISPKFADLLLLPETDPRRKCVPLANPLSEEQSVMRTTLIPGLLETARGNIFREIRDVHIFEIGRVFWPRAGEPLPEERHHLGILITGMASLPSCHTPSRMVDFFDLKGLLESLFEHLYLSHVDFVPHTEEPFLRKAVSATIEVHKQPVGKMGEIAPRVRESLDFPQPIFVCEIDLEKLFSFISEERTYRPLPKFPATTRDLALLLGDEILAANLLSFIQEEKVPYLEKVFVLDVYQGPNIPAGKKSLTLRFVYRAQDRTLTDEEVNSIQEKIAAKIIKHFRAQPR